ncbi:MAG: 2-phosphosulfolactate phosphatase [Melioribacteraceae bacterium]|nr:2-phosphosulfolactate phosphatase [Melioribacteraceae bacterium]MCF8263967.1 2-phosphosulfolactate phosphatase [Melioribacteraceae bacterium]MCF8411819.1 2-phosphosulfolactate phosphatase [Melioribacteraceae bacterium]MCF8431812.1 2-phosphosulfolactate phosphatase [Melioribacteraceae bacterium]
MKIHTLFSPLNADELYFTGRTTVVIDVLRATSTIDTALSNGAKEIIPVDSVEFAMKISGNAFGGQTLIGGERNTKKIDGFHLGNSPLDYSVEKVSGKSIILFTTNGSKAIVRAKFSENLHTCSFLNLSAMAEYLYNLGNEVTILCAGFNGMFCLEDTICAGKLITEIEKFKENIELTDASKASISLSKSFGRGIKKMLSETQHGKLLIENGFEDDIEACSQSNSSSSIPFYRSGVIKLPKENPEVKTGL